MGSKLAWNVRHLARGWKHHLGLSELTYILIIKSPNNAENTSEKLSLQKVCTVWTQQQLMDGRVVRYANLKGNLVCDDSFDKAWIYIFNKAEIQIILPNLFISRNRLISDNSQSNCHPINIKQMQTNKETPANYVYLVVYRRITSLLSFDEKKTGGILMTITCSFKNTSVESVVSAASNPLHNGSHKEYTVHASNFQVQ